MSEEEKEVVLTVLRLIRRELDFAAASDGAGDVDEEPGPLLTSVLQRCRELNVSSSYSTPAAWDGELERQAAAPTRRGELRRSAHPSAVKTGVRAAPRSLVAAEPEPPAARTARGQPATAAEAPLVRLQRALEEERRRCLRLEARVAQLEASSGESELRSLLRGLAEAEAEARAEVAELRLQLQNAGLAMAAARGGSEPAVNPSPRPPSPPPTVGGGELPPLPPSEPGQSLPELMTQLSLARSLLAPSSDQQDFSLPPMLDIDSDGEDDEDVEEETAEEESACERARALLAAAEQDARRLAAEAQSLREAADSQATEAAFATELFTFARDAAAGACAAVAASSEARDPLAYRHLVAAKLRAEADAARLDSSARSALELATSTAAAAAASADAASFALATARARCVSVTRAASRLRRRSAFAEKRSALAAQRSKLAAALRSERAECDAACREVNALVAVLTANGKAHMEAEAARVELASLPGGDMSLDFPLMPAAQPQRSALLSAIAAERDRLTRHLAAVGRRHDVANRLNTELRAHLQQLKEAAGGEREQSKPAVGRASSAGRILLSPFERVLAAMQ